MEQLLKLQDVCIAKTSNITQNSLSNENGEYPIYGASGLIKNIGFYQQDKEYIAIVKDGSGVGRVSLHPAYSSVIGTMQYIIPNNNIIDTKFLFHYLKYLNLSKYSVGMAIPHIYFKDYKNEALNVPSLEIQKEKSKTLDNLVKLIDIKEQILKKYDNLVKSQFIEMFDNKNFEQVLLSEVIDYEQPTKYIVSSENYKDEYATPVLTAGKSFILGFTNEINGIYKGSDKPTLIFDDFTTDCKYVDFDFKVKSSAMKLLHLKNADEQLLYYFCAINKIGFKPESHQRHWISKFANFKVEKPPIELQNQFADFVKHIDKLKFRETITKFKNLYYNIFNIIQSKSLSEVKK